MNYRAFALGLVLAAVGGSCMTERSPGETVNIEGPLPGIGEGQDAASVRAAMGRPDAHAHGWWSGAHTFNMEYEVWYYRGKGRVVFTPDTLVVVASEADSTEDGRP